MLAEGTMMFQVPFRLTRMMVKAMEVSGVEGTYRQTCELVMRVLRMEKDRVMAMLEAFIYDPLINWRLVKDAVGGNNGGQEQGHEQEQSQGLSPNSLYLQGHEPDPVSHPALGVHLDPLGGVAEEGEGLDVEMGLESHDLQKIRSEKDSGQGNQCLEVYEIYGSVLSPAMESFKQPYFKNVHRLIGLFSLH